MKRSFRTLVCLCLFMLAAVPAEAAPFAGEVYCQSSFRNQFFFILLADGHVRAGIPKGGLEAFDFAKDRAENPAITGTYAWNGEQITFTFGGGKAPYTWTRKRKPNGDEEMQGYMWIKEYPFKAGQTLDGTYEGGVVSAPGARVFVFGSSACTFRPDGTFSQESAAVTNGTSATSGASAKQGGTYSIAGYTLTVKGQDGSTSTYSISNHFKPTDPAQPAMIVLDGRVMTRK